MRSLALGLLALAAALPAGAQQTHLLVVSGLPGEARFATAFAEYTKQLTAAASTRYGVPVANLVTLSDAGTGASKSTRDNVLAALRTVGGRAGEEDDVVIVFFGHGSESGGEAKLNLSGPDLTAKDLSVALATLRARRVTVINTASASGAFLKPLAGEGRIVITATKSGNEQNETMFPRYIVAALAGDGADADKDGRVSLFEAFDYARREVERAYTSEQRLQTEHPLLDADGDGVGTASPVATAGDGAAARLAFLGTRAGPASSAGAPAAASPQLRALYEEKSRIERGLEALRARRTQLQDAEYQKELEKLLLELSRNGQAIRRLEGGAK